MFDRDSKLIFEAYDPRSVDRDGYRSINTEIISINSKFLISKRFVNPGEKVKWRDTPNDYQYGIVTDKSAPDLNGHENRFYVIYHADKSVIDKIDKVNPEDKNTVTGLSDI